MTPSPPSLPSLSDLIIDHINNEKIPVGIRVRLGITYLTLGGREIAQIRDSEVRFSQVHLNAANPKFITKLEHVIKCFISIMEVM